MTSPVFEDFESFFAAATGNRDGPFPYQERLATGRDFPELLEAPTGLGKTAAAILAWLWRRRFADETTKKATPRRLVYCLPMRVLVEQTRAAAESWLRNVCLSEDITVHVLMGGEEAGDWVLYPERESVLIGTQDMLLSRALNRGYASGRARWPMEFGLLSNDSLWVFDEIQLMGSGLATSLQLQAWRESLPLRPQRHSLPQMCPDPVFGPVRSLWMSATMAKHWLDRAVDWRPKASAAWDRRVKLDEDDKANNYVRELFQIKKQLPLRDKPIVTLRASTGPKQEAEAKTREYLRALAAEIVKNQGPNGVTLVIVNTVERASDLFTRVRESADRTLVNLIHSRFRPHERRKWMEPGGPLDKSNQERRIIISTQVVEAGVDFSAQVLFTELAPWPSLVQRFGRCARYPGETGTVYWMEIPADSDLAMPYEREELELAREQLKRIGKEVGDVGLAALEAISLDDTQKQKLLPYDPSFVPRQKDLFDLFDTTPDLTGADVDISRFIREGQELDVMVYWRDVSFGENPGSKDRPHRDELCPVAFYRFRQQLPALRKHGRIWRRHYRRGWEGIDEGNPETIFPGQVFLLEAGCGGYSRERGWTGDPEDVVSPVPPQLGRELSNEQESDEEEGKDRQCESQWLTIAEHCRNVCRILRQHSLRDERIRDAVGDRFAEILALAARWHDRGKAHAAFQAKLKPAELKSTEAQQRLSGQPAAKAPKQSWRDWTIPNEPEDPEDRRRPGFRHELASALGALETLWEAQPDHPSFSWPRGLDKQQFGPLPAPPEGDFRDNLLAQELARLSAEGLDLFVYLVAAHHGKVRMSLRASPDDTRVQVPDPCPGETPQARGVRDGDNLSRCQLPGPDGQDSEAPDITLHLDPMSLGLSNRYGPSWRERTQGLLERFGPFRLAYLEALLRAADWLASSEERLGTESGGGLSEVREKSETYGKQLDAARAFVQRWSEAGPALEEQRCIELQELDDETARKMMLDVFDFWRPSEFDDLGAGMVEQQRIFSKLRDRDARGRKSGQ